MRTLAPNSTPAPTSAPSSPATWLFSGGLEPIEAVDKARAARLEDSGGLVDAKRPWGVRSDAAYRRYGAKGGRPGLSACDLEAARLGLDRHRAHLHQQRTVDLDTLAELEHRCAVPGDFGGRDLEVPAWFRSEGSDGAMLVPRRLWPFLGLVWWAYSRGRFGVLASTVELGAHFGVDPRTIRTWRRLAVRLGLMAKGEHTYRDKAGNEIPHSEAIRTWRPGREPQLRPCDRDRNIYRPGPVLEAFGGRSVVQGPGRAPRGRGGARRASREARKAAGALRRAAKVSAYRRTGEVWDRETGRERLPEGAKRGEPRPVKPARLARTAVHSPAPGPRRPSGGPLSGNAGRGAPSRRAAEAQPTAPRGGPISRPARSRADGIARIFDPGSPDPSGPSGLRGQGPRTPSPGRFAAENERAPCESASPTAGASCRGPGDFRAPTRLEAEGGLEPGAPVRLEAPPGGGARSGPGPAGEVRTTEAEDRRLRAQLAELGRHIWGERPPPDPEPDDPVRFDPETGEVLG